MNVLSACRRIPIHLFIRNCRITLASTQSRFPGIRWQFLGALPVAEIEPSPAFPANDELLLKSLERTAIEAVRFNGTGNPVLSE